MALIFKNTKRTFQQKINMLITIDFTAIEFKDVQTEESTAKYCIRFNRGSQDTKQTVWRTLKVDRYTIEYKNERFTRKSGFYFNSTEVQEKSGTITVVELRNGKETEVCKQELDLSGLMSKTLVRHTIGFKQAEVVTKVFIDAQVYPEAREIKDCEFIDLYLVQHEQKKLLTERDAGLLEKAAGVLFTPVKAVGGLLPFSSSNVNDDALDAF